MYSFEDDDVEKSYYEHELEKEKSFKGGNLVTLSKINDLYSDDQLDSNEITSNYQATPYTD